MLTDPCLVTSTRILFINGLLDMPNHYSNGKILGSPILDHVCFIYISFLFEQILN